MYTESGWPFVIALIFAVLIVNGFIQKKCVVHKKTEFHILFQAVLRCACKRQDDTPPRNRVAPTLRPTDLNTPPPGPPPSSIYTIDIQNENPNSNNNRIQHSIVREESKGMIFNF